VTSTYPPLGSNGLKTYPGFPGTGFAVGTCAWVEAFFDGLGEGLERSVTAGGDDRGPGLGPGFVVGRCWVVVVDGVTVRPGVVTVSDVAVVVVVVVCVSPSNCRRMNWRGASST